MQVRGKEGNKCGVLFSIHNESLKAQQSQMLEDDHLKFWSGKSDYIHKL